MPKKKVSVPKYTSNDPYTLFDVSGEMKAIIREITIAQEDKDYEAIEDLTEELIELIELHGDKYVATIHVILDSLGAAEKNQAIAAQFQAKATAHSNLAKRLKQRLHDDMKHHGMQKVEAGIFTVRTHKNSIPTLTVNADPEDLPKEFQKIEADTDELRYALARGDEIKGVTLEKGEHIRIKARG